VVSPEKRSSNDPGGKMRNGIWHRYRADHYVLFATLMRKDHVSHGRERASPGPMLRRTGYFYIYFESEKGF
jgi:hypothetical protein